MNERILFVDDDPNLLAGCERSFRRQFPLDTAEGGEAGLGLIESRGPYAVVVADMHMPGMNGIAFLTAVRERSPDTVRIMLTGNADLDTAIHVVNEGNIFRFLTKPCPPEVLGKAVDDARSQYRLVTSERELLNRTLSGSIKLLTDMLSLMEPKSFGRAETLRALVSEVARKHPADALWELHLAAMLASIGNITLPAETVVRARAGQVLSKPEEQMVSKTPEIAARLLMNIPRLESVARIVRYQHKRFDGSGFPEDSLAGTAIPYGARLLKILADMMQLQESGIPRHLALDEMVGRQGWYDPQLLAQVRTALLGDRGPLAATREKVSVAVRSLEIGMVLQSDMVTRDGMLILSAGHRINDMTLEKIQNFAFLSGIREPVFVEKDDA